MIQGKFYFKGFDAICQTLIYGSYSSVWILLLHVEFNFSLKPFLKNAGIPTYVKGMPAFLNFG